MKAGVSKALISKRLDALRLRLAEMSFDAVIARSTNNYLSEYIPLEENDRAYLSGFSGSTGDLLVTSDSAWLFVDGRYHIQAEKECPDGLIHVVKLSLGDSILLALSQKLTDIATENGEGCKVCVDGKKISCFDFELLQTQLDEVHISLDDCDMTEFIPSDRLVTKEQSQNIELIPLSITGRSTADKVKLLQKRLLESGCNYFLISQLDDVAYICNFRSYDAPCNSTVKGFILISLKGGHLFLSHSLIPDWIKKTFQGQMEVHLEDELENILQSLIVSTDNYDIKVGFDSSRTSYRWIRLLENSLGNGFKRHNLHIPIAKWKQIKTAEELNHMTESFHRADVVIKKAMDWLNESIDRGEKVSEKDFSYKVKELFLSHKAKGLSFEVITASGENSAIVHYTDSDPDKFLVPGELMLLDTGAYFEGGYATDLTRTFLIGGDTVKATARQKEIYTLVLKSAIRLLKARFPKGTTGSQLDTMARSVLWDYSYTFNHGTGHGVGISVHESPPRLSGTSNDVIEAGMVFSVEPGIYIEGYGGVRIENLVTVEADSTSDKWLQIKPLTFCPLDEKLIDLDLLDRPEREWLAKYQQRFPFSEA